MEKALAAVAAELAAKAEPGWEYLTLRATCDSGFAGHRVTAGRPRKTRASGAWARWSRWVRTAPWSSR
jgi:hypothetical protein